MVSVKFNQFFSKLLQSWMGQCCQKWKIKEKKMLQWHVLNKKGWFCKLFISNQSSFGVCLSISQITTHKKLLIDMRIPTFPKQNSLFAPWFWTKVWTLLTLYLIKVFQLSRREYQEHIPDHVCKQIPSLTNHPWSG